MCGIFVQVNPKGVTNFTLSVALDNLKRRGPNGQDTWSSGPVGFAHTRLAMTGGPQATQPIHYKGSVGVVNGELYNHEEIRSLLHEPTGPGDAAVLVAWLVQEGIEGLWRCRGAFVAVVWDGESLLAVRDRFGIKPLYWKNDTSFSIASHPDALLSLPEWDDEALRSMLSHQYLLPDQSIFKGIKVLEPGSWIRYSQGEVHNGRWWEWQPETFGTPPTVQQLSDTVEAAVQERCIADQPVASLLSAGLDSALVAAMASKYGVNTAYTVQFVGNPGWDESEGAREVAEHIGLDHRIVPMTQEDLLEAFDEAVVASGGPVINTHVAAKYLLCKRIAADGFAGILSGEGADEVFWGYEHLVQDASDFKVQGRDQTAGIHLPSGATLDTSDVQKAWGFTPSFLKAKASLSYKFSLISSGQVEPSMAPLVDALGKPPSGDDASVSAWSWAKVCLAGSILQRLCDPLEMAWGIEGRMPLLEYNVASMASDIPSSSRCKGGQGKVPLRAVAELWLPQSTVQRPKHPFMGPPLVIDDAFVQRILRRPLTFLDMSKVEDYLYKVRAMPLRERTSWDPVWLMILSCQALAEHYNI